MNKTWERQRELEGWENRETGWQIRRTSNIAKLQKKYPDSIIRDYELLDNHGVRVDWFDTPEEAERFMIDCFDDIWPV